MTLLPPSNHVHEAAHPKQRVVGLGSVLLVLCAVLAYQNAPHVLRIAAGMTAPGPGTEGDGQVIKTPPRSVRSFSSLQVVQPEETRYHSYIVEAAAEHQIDPALLRAVIHVESNFAERAVSRVGARGLMQLMPATAKQFGVGTTRLLDARTNIRAGAAYLSALADQFGDTNADLVLAAYNAGPTAVVRYRGIPPFPATRRYVKKVTALWERAGAMAALIDG